MIPNLIGNIPNWKEIKNIAKKYNLLHIDSGLLYRKVAKLLIDYKIDFKDKNQIKKTLINNKKLSLRNDSNLRNEQIGKVTSIVAKMNLIRNYINKQQITLTTQKSMKKGFVIDGRDIGSVVFKNADLKLFIEVKASVRAKRRHKQLIDLSEKSIYAQILKEIKLRDKQDMARSNSPLVIPKGANIIDNSELFNNTQKKINKLIGQIL